MLQKQLQSYKKIYKAVKAKKLPKGKTSPSSRPSTRSWRYNADEAQLAKDAEAARDDAVLVDSFDVENFNTNLLKKTSKLNGEPF